uniref:AIG1-type G domain-containing protein n=1 Tax=Physcomitrium patens TaxID=3218 RepID=A0A7I4CT97_PHYPA
MATVSEKEWTGFQGLPAATQIILHTLLAKLRKQKVDKITIVLLGKGGVGKSSIVNSLFSERVAAVSAFRSETLRPRQYSRSKDGFKLTVIDTPGFVEAGRVDAALNSIRRYLLGKTINVVLYVDRLDGPREDKVDVKISRAISQAFGPQIWPHVIVVFTHAEIHLEDVTYSEFVSRRSAALRNIILKESRFKTVNTKVPFVLVENCSRCSENGEHEKLTLREFT